jgi:hypothetical protein
MCDMNRGLRALTESSISGKGGESLRFDGRKEGEGIEGMKGGERRMG